MYEHENEDHRADQDESEEEKGLSCLDRLRINDSGNNMHVEEIRGVWYQGGLSLGESERDSVDEEDDSNQIGERMEVSGEAYGKSMQSTNGLLEKVHRIPFPFSLSSGDCNCRM